VMKGKGDHCFRDNQNGWGWLKLVTHQTLRFANDKLLPSDCLNILCVMKFRGSEVTTSGTSRPTSTFPMDFAANSQGAEVASQEYTSGMLDLLQTGDLADIEVVCKGRTFSCHKAILGSKSLVFRAAFVHNMMEKATGKINIESLEPETVADMLTYIYGGSIERVEDKASRLLAAADQYDLKLLKKKCEELLARSLNISNCLEYLILADLHSTDMLKPLVIRFVVENSREVVTQDSWKEKLTAFPDVFAEVFNELASQPPKKKQKSSDLIKSSHEPEQEWRGAATAARGAASAAAAHQQQHAANLSARQGSGGGGQGIENFFRNNILP